MLKYRLQGTRNAIKMGMRIILRSEKVEIVSISDLYPEKGSNKYHRVYVDVVKVPSSKEIDGAVRGFFKAGNEIKGQANFLSVDGAVDKIAEMNVANAAMGVASLVVGQYYMKQINSELESMI